MSEPYVPNPGERRLVIDPVLCTHDHVCVPAQVCPVSALKPQENGPTLVDHRACILCRSCIKTCPMKAISIRTE